MMAVHTLRAWARSIFQTLRGNTKGFFLSGNVQQFYFILLDRIWNDEIQVKLAFVG